MFNKIDIIFVFGIVTERRNIEVWRNSLDTMFESKALQTAFIDKWKLHGRTMISFSQIEMSKSPRDGSNSGSSSGRVNLIGLTWGVPLPLFPCSCKNIRKKLTTKSGSIDFKHESYCPVHVSLHTKGNLFKIQEHM